VKATDAFPGESEGVFTPTTRNPVAPCRATPRDTRIGLGIIWLCGIQRHGATRKHCTLYVKTDLKATSVQINLNQIKHKHVHMNFICPIRSWWLYIPVCVGFFVSLSFRPNPFIKMGGMGRCGILVNAGSTTTYMYRSAAGCTGAAPQLFPHKTFSI
jgi:hypothetical protein